MAPTKSKKSNFKEKKNILLKYYKQYVNLEFAKSLVFDPSKLPIVSVVILLLELILNVFVVENIKYTEIDWIAYMQESEGFLNGTTNYSLLKGDTGPLVYPAGFVYIYSIFYFITSRGENIKLAQYIFIFIYLIQMFLVLRLYSKSRKIPPYVLVITAFTSYRIHSIYVLRLFNDPIAILFLYISLNLFMDDKWSLGSLFFSLAVSVKMNALLFAPAILLLYITNLGYMKTLIQLTICGVVQILLGLPFLLTYPIEYLKGSFDIGRVFDHKWTVNYRFLQKEFFENKIFHFGLLALHILLLIVFFKPCFKYLQSYCRLRSLEKQLQPQINAKNKELKMRKMKNKNAPNLKQKKVIEKEEEEVLSKDQQSFLNSFEKTLQKSSGHKKIIPQEEEQIVEKEPEKYSIHFDKSTQLALLPIFLSNFIGIVCARSLHYQFYVWYFHSLPYLTWFTDFSTSFKFLLLALIELAWNTYPSTIYSSILLHVCHIILLYRIFSLLRTKVK